jgi:tripartite-type tricarboxylate transporter receptor subunit TctC
MMKRFGIGAILCALALSIAPALAQNKDAYPARPIRFIVPFPAGGATDIISRLVGERLGTSLAQTVVMDNRPGATGNIGLDMLAKAPPDGYTISLASSGVAISATLVTNLPFDPVRDFAHLTLVAVVPNLYVTAGTLPAATLREFIALVKQKPGGYNYASGGIGATNHVAVELFNLVAGVKLVHIPYKGTTQALSDVMAGQIHLMLIGPPAAEQHVRAGRLRALAIAYQRRIPAMPEVPTTAEAGVKGIEAANWYGTVAPAKTPAAVVARLNREMVAALGAEEMKKQFAALGAETQPMTPQEFAAFMQVEVAKWGKVVRAANIRPE